MKMHRIASFDSISARHAAYQRELEKLAQDCEEHVITLESGLPNAQQWVIDQMKKQIERIYAAGVLEKESDSKGKHR